MNSLKDVNLRAIAPRTLLLVSLAVLTLGWIKFALPDAALYALDYLVRIIVIGMIVFSGGFRFKLPTRLNWLWLSSLAILATAIDLILFRLYQFFYEPIPILGEAIFEFPPIADAWFYAFDLSAGLILVALSEELVFRFLFVKAFPASRVMQYALSCIAFGLFHAPQGLLLVITAALSGLIAMALYRTTRTLAAPVLSHYLVNLIIFSDVLFITNITLQF